MADSLKITSSIPPAKPAGIPNKPSPIDAIFGINDSDLAVKMPLEPTTANPKEESFKETLFQNLNKEILKPLKNSTKGEADILRRLVLLSELFESSPGGIPKSFMDQIFMGSQDFLSELLTRDKTETVFKGAFFDSLRALAKMEGYPQLKETIVSILRHYDAYVNRNQTLKAILTEITRMTELLPQNERVALELKLSALQTAVNADPQDQKAIQSLLKNQTIPLLGQILKNHAFSENLYHSVLTIINHIVRYDKGDVEHLEEALLKFSQALKPISNLTSNEFLDMKNLLFFHTEEAENLFKRMDVLSKDGKITEKADLSTLLLKALDDSSPSKIRTLGLTLLDTMVRNESPIFPVMHFLIPLHYLGSNSYGEFFIDKDASEKKGNAKSATNIFFTIQSDRYGNFEVELLVRDQIIDLDIRCPGALIEPLKNTRGKIRSIIEEQGYKLLAYGVGEYVEGQTILQRYPKLALRKVGLDVKI
ncbi:hypothetical protein [Acetobacterium bakii]|uniref:Uncharacterized protein n=1 Tax=Acetobacterium bakii TaxID=52689 RepID=A0A0L6U071_9FIRM|nr:hypothetical protein [Acetobacterium bakii]KNZ41747.1 hypothetical protein AKG39_08915 [Acetobacterium bakii]